MVLLPSAGYEFSGGNKFATFPRNHETTEDKGDIKYVVFKCTMFNGNS